MDQAIARLLIVSAILLAMVAGQGCSADADTENGSAVEVGK
jgi:hypothetical protein